MKKIASFIFLIAQSIFSSCFAKIIQTNDAQIIEGILEKEVAKTSLVTQDSKNTLVIFDVDDVLIHPIDEILKSKNGKKLNKWIKKLYSKLGEKMPDEKSIKKSIVMLKRKATPVDHRLISCIQILQKKGIKVLALTKCPTGKMGLIANIEDWRINELHDHGYYFDKSWENLAPVDLNAFMQDAPHAHPMYKSGIVFVGEEIKKGPALQAFIEYSAIKPNKIVFIDDKIENLVSVENVAKKHDIEFVGIEYTAALEGTGVWNDDIANLQLETLEKNGTWISDTQAEKMLNSQKKGV